MDRLCWGQSGCRTSARGDERAGLVLRKDFRGSGEAEPVRLGDGLEVTSEEKELRPAAGNGLG